MSVGHGMNFVVSVSGATKKILRESFATEFLMRIKYSFRTSGIS